VAAAVTVESEMRTIICLASFTVAALVATASMGQALPQKDGRPVAGSDPMVLGSYDPHGDFTNDPTPEIEHLFLPWLDVDLASLPLADNYARERGRALWITVEPWTWDQSKRITPDELRDDIASGAYDEIIGALCGEIARLQRPVTVRFAQEMEDKTGRFIWSNWDPASYISAYRHFVENCRAVAPSARFMWSPKGDEGLERYYPGDDVVDDIGLSIFDLQQFDQDSFGRDRFFAERVQPGYDRVIGFNKPIYIAELGYVGDLQFVEQWARESLLKYPQFPGLIGVSYFNDKEVVAWPEPYGLPDWRVTNNIVE
jgi:beta-mannanase